MMDKKAVLFLSVMFANCVPIQTVPVTAVIKTAGTAYDVLNLGLDLMQFMETFDNEEAGENLDELVNILAARIDASTTKLITTVLLQSKLERIDDAVINIHSSLIDLQNFLQASTPDERNEYKKLFVSRFVEHDVIKHIRFLPELLYYTIPGTSGKLVDLFAENTRCNMTAIYEFKLYYAELVSDGIALQLIYIRTSSNLSVNRTIEYWSEKVNKVNLIFDAQENSCKYQFSKYAEEDLRASQNASILWVNNKERYPWKTCDVIFLKNYRTFQFLYLKHTGDYLFSDMAGDRSKISIFHSKIEAKPNIAKFSKVNDKCESAIKGQDDEEAAKNIGICVEKYCTDLNFSINALLVFFDGGDFSSEAIIIDPDSSSLAFTFEDVTLRFCHKSGLQCKADIFNWLDGTETVAGKMRVFAYVQPSTQEVKIYKESSGPRINCFTEFIYLLTLVGIALLDRTLFR